MSVTIKTEIIEPITETSIKEEPIDYYQREEEKTLVEETKPSILKLGSVKLPPKRRKKLQGMKAKQLWHHMQTNIIKFCQENRLIASSVTCRCGQPMELAYQTNSSDNVLWKCKSDHGVTLSLRKGTWFEESELQLSEILWIAYMWVHEYSYNSILHETNQSIETLVDWCTNCEEVCRAILECKCDPLGNLVEIFECKIIENKNGKKRKNKSCWVFCGLEQFSTKTVLIIAEDKKSKTIMEIYDKYILPGSTVFGNTWNVYEKMSRKDFEYLTKEKSLSFYDTVSKIELGTVEDLWQASVRAPPSTNGYLKYEFNSQFCEYLYRKSLSFASDAYLTYLRDIAKIYTPHDCVDQVGSILSD